MALAPVSRPLWQLDTSIPEYPPLTTDIQADVVVAGAGIAGLTTALLLAEAGKRVVVLERGQPLRGETGNTTAHLASAIDDRLYLLEKAFGEDGARLAAQSQADAIQRIETIIGRYSIACDFKRLDAYLYPAEGESADSLRDELDASQRAGLQVVWLDASPANTGYTGACIQYRNQARFHPLKYLAGVLAASQQLGVAVYGNTQATEFDEKDGQVLVKTANGPVVTAAHCVVATNSPVNEIVSIHTKQAPYRTYAIAYSIPAGAVPDALIWDDEEYYHYIRQQEHPTAPDQMLLIVGGADHKAGQNDTLDHFAELDAWSRKHYPQIRAEYTRWSGMVQEPADGLPFLGLARGSERTYIVTGDSGQGMTNTTIGAEIIRDLIQGYENPYAKLYSPTRLMTHGLHTVGEYIKENLNVASTFTEYVKGGDVDSVDDIQPGTGAIVRDGLRKLAVYRSETGDLHRHSAVCTHVGCQVQWNDVEHLWDCPCHGSRFAPTGEVLGGPATRALDPVDGN